MRLDVKGFTAALVWLGVALADVAPAEPRQVAIIGAGAAGSSAAYYIRKFAEQDGVTVNITVFERTDRIGGRALTVDVFGDPAEKSELGASIFVETNRILHNATNTFNLSLRDPGPDEDGVLGIWDGDRFVFQMDDASWDWWNLAKLFWRYGRAPYRAQQLMEGVAAKFIKLYEKPFFPFRSLTARAYELDLSKVTGLTGAQYLAQNNIDTLFSHDIIQAGTRVNYASNLANLHGLETMVSLAPNGAVQVEGGNWQIFDKMVEAANATIYMNTTVSSISLAPEKRPGATRPKYTIKVKSAAGANNGGETQAVAFDDVVVANPWQFSGISADSDVLRQMIDEIPYVKLHVTLFTSPFRYSPEFFNLEPGTQAPTSVLTTLADTDDPSSGLEGSGKAGFYSITLHKVLTNPKSGGTEYLYKIFSPMKITPSFLTALLGVEVPESITRRPNKDDPSPAAAVEPISWYHPHVFHSYPKGLPRITFQDPVLGPGIYYTSGMESFISTMETNALMGMNVARLIVDDHLGLSSGHDVLLEPWQGSEQHVLANEDKSTEL